jgi:DNA-binding IclR family transcriptional regulator
MGTLRKILTTGVGAALMTENGIRNALSDMKLKEYLARQASKGKEELTKVVAAELKRFLEHVDLHEEIQKALTGMKLEIQATVTLAAKDKARDHIKYTVKKLKIRKIGS